MYRVSCARRNVAERLNHAGLRLAERRRSRTYQPLGYNGFCACPNGKRPDIPQDRAAVRSGRGVIDARVPDPRTGDHDARRAPGGCTPAGAHGARAVAARGGARGVDGSAYGRALGRASAVDGPRRHAQPGRGAAASSGRGRGHADDAASRVRAALRVQSDLRPTGLRGRDRPGSERARIRQPGASRRGAVHCPGALAGGRACRSRIRPGRHPSPSDSRSSGSWRPSFASRRCLLWGRAPRRSARSVRFWLPIPCANRFTLSSCGGS